MLVKEVSGRCGTSYEQILERAASMFVMKLKNKRLFDSLFIVSSSLRTWVTNRTKDLQNLLKMIIHDMLD